MKPFSIRNTIQHIIQIYIYIYIGLTFLGAKNVTYSEKEGTCEFANPSQTIASYEYEYHYDHYDYNSDDEGKEECLQSCLEKAETTENPAGCHYAWGECTFIKNGTIVGSSGEEGNTCWSFQFGEIS